VENNKKVISDKDRTYKGIINFDFDNTIHEKDSEFIGFSKINPSNYLRVKRSQKYYLNSTFAINSNAQLDFFELLVEMRFFAKTPEDKLKFVVNVFDGTKRLEHKRIDIGTPFNSNPEEWSNLRFKVLLPSIYKTDDIKIQTYIWNKKNGEYLIDDYKISYRIKKGD